MDKWTNFKKELEAINAEARELENRTRAFEEELYVSDVQIGMWFPESEEVW